MEVLWRVITIFQMSHLFLRFAKLQTQLKTTYWCVQCLLSYAFYLQLLTLMTGSIPACKTAAAIPKCYVLATWPNLQ